MEGKLDPEKVREARKRLAATLADRDRIDAAIPDAWKVDDDEGAPHITVPLAEFRLLLAVLSEGREASAPFASIGSEMTAENGWHERDELVIEAAEGAVATIASVPVAAFRRLAAFNELFKEKPDGG